MSDSVTERAREKRVWLWNSVLRDLATFCIVFVACGFLLHRKLEWTFDSFWYSVLFTAASSLWVNDGQSQSTKETRMKLRDLFLASNEPDWVAISEILTASGEDREFRKHRALLGHFVRNRISERAFYQGMHRLVWKDLNPESKIWNRS